MLPVAGLASFAWALACLLCPSTGAPDVSTKDFKCTDFMPSVGSVAAGVDPQIDPSPFIIVLDKDFYHRTNPGLGSITGKLIATGGRTFHSFILGAYKYQDKRLKFIHPEGTLQLSDDDKKIYKTHDVCDWGTGDQTQSWALRSTDTQSKRVINFKWTSNTDTHGHLEFRASFIEDSTKYWVAEQSQPVRDTSDSSKLPRRTQSIPRIDTSECGLTKGCYRQPEGCQETQCLYILTWKPNKKNNLKYIDFELGGLADNAADRYVTVALSDDKYPGDDNVFTCAHNSATDTTEVYLSVFQKDPKRNTPIRKYDDDTLRGNDKYDGIVVEEEGSYTNARLRCRFTVDRDLDDKQLSPQMNAIRGGPQYLIFEHGFAKRGVPNNPWLMYEEIPGASEDKVNLGEVSGDHSGWARFPLTKAHGIFMILAWVLFASIGLLLSKYYKTMWPNKRGCFDRKYWVVGHFFCMFHCIVFTTLAVIVYFVETDGWDQAPYLPFKAHPILLIIIFVCIWIYPLVALIRPGKDSWCRAVFNWFMWFFVTVANVLAIPTIFIGMDLGRMSVPWWATWILVIWVIFHIIVEISLEVHQCCTYKKNKERRKKWEQAKREYPKQTHPEPEPVGRRFKRFMLSLHICITVLITLIMVIIIAVATRS